MEIGAEARSWRAHGDAADDAQWPPRRRLRIGSQLDLCVAPYPDSILKPALGC